MGSDASVHITEMSLMSRLCQLSAFALLGLLPLSAFGATAPLEVTLAVSDRANDAERGIVVVSVTNHSNRPLLILMADSALISDGDHLFNDVMRVADAEGRAVAYRGRAVRPALGNPQAYATIAPGEQKKARVDLPANYAVSGGTYTVTYTQRYGELGDMDPNAAPTKEVGSNLLTLYANAHLIRRREP